MDTIKREIPLWCFPRGGALKHHSAECVRAPLAPKLRWLQNKLHVQAELITETERSITEKVEHQHAQSTFPQKETERTSSPFTRTGDAPASSTADQPEPTWKMHLFG